MGYILLEYPFHTLQKGNKMKLKIFFLAFLAFFMTACSSTDGGSITNPGETVAGVKTCIRSSTSTSLPGGTKAIRKSDSAVALVDANGCYEFKSSVVSNGFLARSLEATDSVQFYNDSALFAITLPYITAGDTVNVVPTPIVLQDVPKAEADSVHLVVYDKVNMLSRKIKLRTASGNGVVDYGRTLWSRDDGASVLVHFQINGKKVLASSVYDVQPGALLSVDWSDVSKSEVPSVIHGSGSFVWHYEDYVDTAFADTFYHVDSVVDTSVKWMKFSAKSIYGISSIKYDGQDSVDVSGIINRYGFAIPVTITDSAGYVTVDTVRIIRQAENNPLGRCLNGISDLKNIADTTRICVLP
jgi:hypothetical protein